MDAGLPVRRGAAAVRRDRRRSRSWNSAARAPSSAWRRTSRTSASTTTGSTTSAPTATCGGSRARDGFDASAWEVALLRARAQGERRRAGPAMDAASRTAGFIYSFNGAHSLFVDTIRSLRALAVGHLLGHDLMEEQDVRVSLLERLVQHARATARYSVFYGNGRDQLRPARPHRARDPLQRRQRQLPRPVDAAGLLAVQHVDARPRVGDARVRRATGVRRDAAGRGTRALRRPRRRRVDDAERRARDVRPLPRGRVRPTACPTGTPARPASRALPGWRDRPADPFNDRRTGGQFRGGDRARRGSLRLARVLAARGEAEDGRALRAGGPARRSPR